MGRKMTRFQTQFFLHVFRDRRHTFTYITTTARPSTANIPITALLHYWSVALRF